MGTGKSYWGSRWAAIHHKTFIDLDELVEEEQDMSIADIFERKSEAFFRECEAGALRSTERLNDCIIACGGGTPCFFDNMKWMNAHGITVLLTGRPSYLLANILKETNKRPAVKDMNENELIFFIEQKLKERQPFYDQSAIILDSAVLDERSIDSLFND